MSTYEDLAVGDVFETPSGAVDDETVRAIVEVGGYTHPLFTDPGYAASSPFGRTPLPGQGVLLIMGGLIEQSDRFDETVVALVGLDAVRFAAPALPGDSLRVRVEVTDKKPSRSGERGTLVMSWRCLNGRDELVAEASATMLLHIGG